MRDPDQPATGTTQAPAPAAGAAGARPGGDDDTADLGAGMDRYELVARLGRGGMGVVDLARAPDGRKVALKRLTLQGSASEIARSRQRLLREASVLRRLDHPHIVRLIDVVDEGDEIVLVMPYLAGGSLAERVA
ncbi:MAG TPA: protein kinase, partial [Acidimicrobiales bacterium]|nr:protein kinase [Acidimicrobiales bacterium]